MQVNISGRHMTVTPPIKAYIEEKIAKVSRAVGSDELTIEIVLSHDKNPSIPSQNHVEITGSLRDYKLRVEEAAPDMYAAIDSATNRFERQTRKYKTRMLSRRQKGEEIFHSAPGDTEAELGPLGEIVRSKQFKTLRLSEDEAILHMEMLGHDFFMFILDATGESAVVYKRASGDYGLLRME